MAIQECSPTGFVVNQSGDGHREYWVSYKILVSAPYGYSGGSLLETSYPHAALGEGPRTVANCPGLPTIGDHFQYGSDIDLWAKCHPDRRIRPFDQKGDEQIQVYMVEVLFSTRPLKRCFTSEWGNPLLEPQRVSGSFVSGKIEATKDRSGNLIKSSSHEMYRGPQVEFDSGSSTVRIEQNVSTLQLGLCTSLCDTVNDDTLWGLGPRRVKLSAFSWEELWYDICTFYYKRVFEFEVKNKETDSWDRKIVDEGTKVLNGRWTTAEDGESGRWKSVPISGYSEYPNPDPSRPDHFTRYKDRWGENARAILNGEGKPAESTELVVISEGSGITGTESTGAIAEWLIEYYPESDFTQLGIPSTIDYGTAS